MRKQQVYLDYAATTPIHDVAIKGVLKGNRLIGNPSSLHAQGRKAHEALSHARQRIAELLGCRAEQLIFTSGATEANNNILKSFSQGHVITSCIEHRSVLDTCKALESSALSTSYLPVDSSGIIHLSDLKRALQVDTQLVSIMGVNNETGVIQPLSNIISLARESGVSVHADMAQWLGKKKLSLDSLTLDYASFSAHKIYGPKGVGILYAKDETKLTPLLTGGGQERKKRSGTPNISGILGMQAALEWVCGEGQKELKKTKALKALCIERVLNTIPGSWVNGSIEASVSEILNLGFKGIQGSSLMMNLDLEGISISTGSACSTGSLSASHVISALGGTDALSAIRVSFGAFTTEQDIVTLCGALQRMVKRMRKAGGP